MPYEGLPKVKRHPKSTHADSTPATDGKYVDRALRFPWSLRLRPEWKALVETGPRRARRRLVLRSGLPVGIRQLRRSSIKNLVIVQADIQKDSFIAAYDIKNGKRLWKTPREEISSWGTPTVYEGKTRAELDNQRIQGHPRL